MMTNGYSEGRIFSILPSHEEWIFLLAHHCFLLFKNKLPEVPEYAEIQCHMMTSFKHNNDAT